jgi:hypothetical protein
MAHSRELGVDGDRWTQLMTVAREAGEKGWWESYSDGTGNCVEVAACWRKSRHSGDDGNCVEVSMANRAVGVRDSKLRDSGPVLEFTSAAWQDFSPPPGAAGSTCRSWMMPRSSSWSARCPSM